MLEGMQAATEGGLEWAVVVLETRGGGASWLSMGCVVAGPKGVGKRRGGEECL